MDLNLNGKVAMVAGASRGLGFAIAKALASEGARVSIASRDAKAIAAAAHSIQDSGQVQGFAADVRSAEGIASWHRSTVEQFGDVELLVTNSGGPPGGPTPSFDDAAWQNAYELLVLSAVRLTRAVLPEMKAHKKGSIVLMTSSSVKEPIANLSLSNVLRPSVAALAKTLAMELASEGIRVNHVIPGRISTDRVRELDEAASKRQGITVAQQQARSQAKIPMGRYGQPEEFARAVVFLLSDAASFITGASLQVDGGQIRSVL